MNTNYTNSMKSITGDPHRDANIRETSFLVLKARKLAEAAKAKQAKQEKPDWITDEQWKAVPSEDWWKNQKSGTEYIKQSSPATP